MSHISIKGLMVDMGRITERHEYYFDLPARAAAWGYNTLFLHFTDDQGCAMRFAGHPELATPHAFTKAKMRRWIDEAKTHGVRIVPELETLGHTGCIYNRRKYRHLKEDCKGFYGGINPLHPETHRIMGDLIAELAEVFESPYIHAGLDEVGFGSSPQCRQALKTKERWEIYAEYTNRIHRMITEAGKQMMMWGDHILSEPRIAQRISRDIIICDWHYGPYYPVDDSMKMFTDMGFRVIGCPASCRAGEMIMPTWLTPVNLQRFSRLAHKGGRNVIGLMNTLWTPQRLLCDIEDFALALGGAWFSDPDADINTTVELFVKDEFGISRTGRVAAIILDLCATVPPGRDVFLRMLGTLPPRCGKNWHPTDFETTQAENLAKKTEKIGRFFRQASSRVRENRSKFDNFLLTCDIIGWACRLYIYRRQGLTGTQKRKFHNEGQRLLKRILKDWDRRRYRRSKNKPAYYEDLENTLVQNVQKTLTRLRG